MRTRPPRSRHPGGAPAGDGRTDESWSVERVSGQRAGGDAAKRHARAHTHTHARAHTHTHTHTRRRAAPRHALPSPRGARELQRANGAKGAKQHRGTQPSHSLEGARVKLAKHQTFRSRGEGVDRFGLTASTLLLLAVRSPGQFVSAFASCHQRSVDHTCGSSGSQCPAGSRRRREEADAVGGAAQMQLRSV